MRGVVVMVALRLPHLVLAHVGRDDRLAAGDAPDVVDHVRRVQVPVVRQGLDVAHRGRRPSSTRCALTHGPWSACSHDVEQVVAACLAGRPQIAASAVTFLLISDGSMSMWIFLAF